MKCKKLQKKQKLNFNVTRPFISLYYEILENPHNYFLNQNIENNQNTSTTYAICYKMKQTGVTCKFKSTEGFSQSFNVGVQNETIASMNNDSFAFNYYIIDDNEEGYNILMSISNPRYKTYKTRLSYIQPNFGINGDFTDDAITIDFENPGYYFMLFYDKSSTKSYYTSENLSGITSSNDGITYDTNFNTVGDATYYKYTIINVPTNGTLVLNTSGYPLSELIYGSYANLFNCIFYKSDNVISDINKVDKFFFNFESFYFQLQGNEV
jgi:hypothetical protein